MESRLAKVEEVGLYPISSVSRRVKVTPAVNKSLQNCTTVYSNVSNATKHANDLPSKLKPTDYSQPNDNYGN